MPLYKFTQEELIEIKDYYDKTKNITKTAKKFGVKRSTMDSLIGRNGWRIPKKQFTTEFKRKVVKSFSSILDYKKVAKKHNVSPTAVRSWVKEFGTEKILKKYKIEQEKRNKLKITIPKAKMKKIRYRFERGENLLSLANEYGYSYENLSYYKSIENWSTPKVKITNKIKEKIELELKDNSITWVARNNGVPYSFVYDYALKHGIKKRNGADEETLQIAKEMVKLDERVPDIAKYVGVAEITIYRWIKKYNWRNEIVKK